MNKPSNLIIDIQAIVDNYNYIKSIKPTTQIAPVVKANAYGLGANEVAKALQNNGASTFFVATLDEALSLRKVTEKQIYVLNGINKGEEKEFEDAKITPVINSYYQLEIWQNFIKNFNKEPTYVIHVNTGMNRLGIEIDELDKIQDLKTLIISHFADAENVKSSITKNQLQNIVIVVGKMRKAEYSFSNSLATINFTSFKEHMARVGIALYGGIKNKNLKNVIRIYSKILQIRTVLKDGFVGYNGIDKVKKDTKLATISIGYADGYLRASAKKAFVFINGKKANVLGKISMDLIVADISDIEDVTLESEVEIIGDNISLEDFADFAQTSSYEVLINFATKNRFNKVYIGV